MKRISLAIAAVISAILSNTLLADSLLITNAQLFIGDDRKSLPRDILIVDGLVDAVAEDLSATEADTVLDADGRTVTPTLFAGITAAGLSEIGMVYEAVDSRLSDLYTGLMHPEFDVRRAYNPHSTVIPVTRIEGFGYTLLMAAPGDRTISGQGSLVRFDGGFDSFEGKTVVYVNVDGSSGNRLGGSRAAHWMLLESAFQELGTDDEDLTLISAAGKQALRATARNGIFVFRANRASDILQSLTFSETHKHLHLFSKQSRQLLQSSHQSLCMSRQL